MENTDSTLTTLRPVRPLDICTNYKTRFYFHKLVMNTINSGVVIITVKLVKGSRNTRSSIMLFTVHLLIVMIVDNNSKMIVERNSSILRLLLGFVAKSNVM